MNHEIKMVSTRKKLKKGFRKTVEDEDDVHEGEQKRKVKKFYE